MSFNISNKATKNAKYFTNNMYNCTYTNQYLDTPLKFCDLQLAYPNKFSDDDSYAFINIYKSNNDIVISPQDYDFNVTITKEKFTEGLAILYNIYPNLKFVPN